MINSLLLFLQLPSQNTNSLEEELSEIRFLAKTLNYNIIDIIIQKRKMVLFIKIKWET